MTPPLDRVRLLLVDDDEDDCVLIRDLLDAVGDPAFEVQWVSSYDEGLTVLRQNAHDMALLDYRLGEHTGLDLLRSARSSGSRVPAVLLTDIPDRSIDLEAMRAGAADFLMKSQLNERLLERSIRYALAEARTLEAMRKSETRFRALIEQFPEAVLVHVGGVLAYVNPATLAYLGYPSADELIGRDVSELIVEDEREIARLAILIGSEGRGPAPPEVVRMLSKDGAIMSAEITGLHITFDGQPAVVTIARDVTERLQTQARLILSDRLASVGTLAAGVAHEINNPLAYVLSNIGFVSEELARVRATISQGPTATTLDEVAAALTDANQGAERVRAIVGDLRTFARTEEDRRGPVDIRRVLELSIHMAQNQIRHRARLVTEFAATPPVEANEGRLGQVFLNLLMNAAHAIPEGGASKHMIRIVTQREEDDVVVVSISDTGAGMTPDVRSRVFDPFFTTKPIGVGTGLGLFVCHNIVNALGGEIRVESEVGQGTTFHVMLPTSRAAQKKKSSRGFPAVVAPRRGRILVVDDEPMIGVSLRRALASEHDLLCLTDAEQALDLLRRGERFDVVLCDLMMPEMTGMEFFDQLAHDIPDLAGKVIFFTGGAFTPRAAEFLERVPNARLQKPADVTKLRELIRDRLG